LVDFTCTKHQIQSEFSPVFPWRANAGEGREAVNELQSIESRSKPPDILIDIHRYKLEEKALSRLIKQRWK